MKSTPKMCHVHLILIMTVKQLGFYGYSNTVTVVNWRPFLQSYQSLRQLTKLSKLEVPSSIMSDLHSIKDNDEAVRKYGVDQAVKMCHELLDSGMVSYQVVGRVVTPPLPHTPCSMLSYSGVWLTFLHTES